MFTKSVKISNKVGLHAKEAKTFVEIARCFHSEIWLEANSKKVNAKALLGIIAFGFYDGMTIVVSAKGIDEQKAGGFISELLEGKRELSLDSVLSMKED